MNLPFVTTPYEDELLFSWVQRLFDENVLDRQTFATSYLGKSSDISDILGLKYDIRDEFCPLMEHINMSCYDLLETYLSLSIFEFSSICMTREEQTLYINNIFRPLDKLNTQIKGLFSTLKICPECVAEDKKLNGQPYFHRAHQLPGVCMCYKHRIRLWETKRKYVFPQTYKLDEYVEVSDSRPDKDMLAYTDYVQALFDCRVHSDASATRNAIYEAMDGYGSTALEEFRKWEHSGLLDDKSNSLLKQRNMIMEQAPSKILSLAMFLYPNPSEFITKIAQNEPILKEYSCPDCGYTYVATPHSVASGWGCPQCDQKLTYDERYAKIVKALGAGEYVVSEPFSSCNRLTKHHHSQCGREVRIKPHRFMLGTRCSCEQLLSYEDAKSMVEAHEGYHLVQYTQGNAPATIHHDVCGSDFTMRVALFCDTPKCPACQSRQSEHVKLDALKKKVLDLVGDEYTVLSYDSAKQVAIIRHNVCGMENTFQKGSFLRGQRCKYCAGQNPNIIAGLKVQGNMKWEDAFHLLQEYRNDRGTANPPKSTGFQGFALGSWCNHQRSRRNQGKLDDQKIQALTDIGFMWDAKNDSWDEMYELYQQYIQETGETYVPAKYNVSGKTLGRWVRAQQERHKAGKLNADREQKLLALNPHLFD